MLVKADPPSDKCQKQVCAQQGVHKQGHVFSGETVTLEYHHPEAFPPAKGFIVRLAAILQVHEIS
jgi:hypothetical protein